MNAVDTNVLVRYLLEDDEDQASRARAAIAEGTVFVSRTVLLETAWVLGKFYRLPAHRVVSGLRKLLGLRQIVVQEPLAVEQALEWVESGMDIADAFHLIEASGCMAFLTFDRDMIRSAARCHTPTVVREL